jgi:hypothetical protein
MFREKLYTKKGTNYHTLCLQNADYFIFWSQQINFQACIESYFESCMWVCMYKIMYNFMLCIYNFHISYSCVLFLYAFCFLFHIVWFHTKKKSSQLDAIRSNIYFILLWKNLASSEVFFKHCLYWIVMKLFYFHVVFSKLCFLNISMLRLRKVHVLILFKGFNYITQMILWLLINMLE